MTSSVRRVVLLHGLWMPALSMRWLGGHLLRAGFAPEFFGYPTVAGGPKSALPRLTETLQRAPSHLVAHSLGGLVALQALRDAPDLPVSRVVCLGSPLCGSAAAAGLARSAWTTIPLGRSADLLTTGCGAWDGRAEVGMIAGNAPLGLGQFFGRLRGPSDGTVALEETRLPGLSDHLVVPASHTGLLFSSEVARQAIEFLRHGRFRKEAANSAAGPGMASG
jgi:pimeloyl-ACP methyl ester carboxylesterase